MKRMHSALFALMIVSMLGSSLAQQASKHVLSADEVKKVTPAEYFYRGHKGPVQMRNAAGFELADGKMTLVALVDVSGYASSVAQKYQGLLITESKLNIGGSSLAPGQYGFGFTADGKFVVTDVADNDVISSPYQTDQNVKNPVPLKLVADGEGYKLYAGKKWVEIKAD
jgi:hypothetical protein